MSTVLSTVFGIELKIEERYATNLEGCNVCIKSLMILDELPVLSVLTKDRVFYLRQNCIVPFVIGRLLQHSGYDSVIESTLNFAYFLKYLEFVEFKKKRAKYSIFTRL